MNLPDRDDREWILLDDAEAEMMKLIERIEGLERDLLAAKRSAEYHKARHHYWMRQAAWVAGEDLPDVEFAETDREPEDPTEGVWARVRNWFGQ